MSREMAVQPTQEVMMRTPLLASSPHHPSVPKEATPTIRTRTIHINSSVEAITYSEGPYPRSF